MIDMELYCDGKVKHLAQLTPSEKKNIVFMDQLISEYTKQGLENTEKALKLKQIMRINVALEQTKTETGFKEVVFPHRSSRGNPVDSELNIKNLFEAYDVEVRFNYMSREMEIKTPGKEFSTSLQNSCTFEYCKDLLIIHNIPTSGLRGRLEYIAGQNEYHPVREWMDTIKWDGITRLPELYAMLEFTPDSDERLLRLLIRKWFIQCVAALYRPDFRNQGVLTLQGAQGIKKSTFWENIVPNSDWVTTDLHLDPSDKDTIIRATKYWIVELGEVDGVQRKADRSQLKNFITMSNDEFRVAYGTCQEKHKRRTCYGASVNPEQFLMDDSNRRWWVIPLDNIYLNNELNTTQLWAEFKHLYDNGEIYWLVDTELEQLEQNQDKNRIKDTIEAYIEEYGVKAAVKVNDKWSEDLLKLKGIGLLEYMELTPQMFSLVTLGRVLKKLGAYKSTATNEFYLTISKRSKTANYQHYD